ncbi:MAG: transporter substrate-binding domain-containing protein [Lachnospiraceae bacterium]|nr:transporter substrate-binding domain-containing protein [Lachnospiraceae bacterium]
MKKLRKLLAVGLATVCAVGMLAGCGGSKDNNSADSNDVENRTTFTVGFDAEYPPYGFMDESGEYVGFDLDLAAEVCERNGWELVKTPIDWDAKDHELDAGTIDCIWNGFTINGREDDYTWSEAYVDNSQVIITKADAGIAKLTDLAGKTVLVQADSAALASLESDDLKSVYDSLGELTQVKDYNTALMTLESGAADAVALDKVVAKYYIQDKEDVFVILDEELSTEQYGIGFKKGNEALRDAVQKTLKEMVADGTFEKIATEWDQQDVIILSE